MEENNSHTKKVFGQRYEAMEKKFIEQVQDMRKQKYFLADKTIDDIFMDPFFNNEMQRITYAFRIGLAIGSIYMPIDTLSRYLPPPYWSVQ